MKVAPLRLLLISGAVLLTVIIYFLPSQVNPGKEDNTVKEDTLSQEGFNPDLLLESAKESLDSAQVQNLAFLESALSKNGDSDTAMLDGMGRFWDRNGIPAAAAIWFEKKAVLAESERTWLDAAFRYFDAFRIAEDSTAKSVLVQKAISAYDKVLSINPGNLNAKTDLGACYADGTSEPMKGIMMLREVVTADPNHEMAQYNLGMLSVKSGQLDKAIERFNNVLRINPKRAEIYFYLGQVQLQKGDTAQAISAYETFIKNASYDASDVIELVKTLKQKRS